LVKINIRIRDDDNKRKILVLDEFHWIPLAAYPAETSFPWPSPSSRISICPRI
jgi:hypothetical protein